MIPDLDVLADACGRVSATARQGDLAAPVSGGLGRWKARDVVAHLGGVHRWATRIVANGSQDGPGFTKSKLDGTPLCDWFEEGARLLHETLSAAEPDGACPNFNPGSANTNRFGIRRQIHETVIHAYDV